ncbi:MULTISPECIES: hypothetical protein [unclassified Endozoicomonas]|uniref:hypothetical protein n=1 Tax=unclassified Endozoicomonas TaxID=2644528 RepID=UPI0021492188|nr:MULTISPECIES: hypothetical protein [unclassified Endozoicomonas]
MQKHVGNREKFQFEQRGGIRGNLFWLSRAGHPVFCKDNQTALPGAIYAGLR